MKYINVFDKDTDYVSFRDGKKYEIPNVSLSKDTKKVHYNLYANGHEYVDLGLPSGTLWATMNVGAKKASDTGLYFQWGDTSGYTSSQVDSGLVTDSSVAGTVTPAKVSKSMASTSSITTGGAGTGGITIPGGGAISPDKYTGKPFYLYDYKWYTGGNYTKYTVTGATLDLEDDAVHVNWGGDWHMPTPDQIKELTANTTTAWTSSDKVSGMTFTSSNGKSIFIPAAGYAWNSSFSENGSNGSVWSSMLSDGGESSAMYLNFDSGGANVEDDDRANGYSMRGVIG